MTVASGNFAELLWPGIMDIWGKAYERYPLLYPQYVKVADSNKAFEKDQQVTGLPLAGVKGEGNSIPYVDPFQGWQKEYVHQTFALGTGCTREMYEDDQYGYINELPSMLAESLRQTEETTNANHLNRAFNTAYTGGDGLSLCNASHTLVGGGTYRNQLAVASDLTQTSFEQAMMDIMDPNVLAIDEQSLKIRIMPRVLVVHPQNVVTARKILETTQVVGNADNDANVARGYISSLVVNPFLTDSDAWFVITDIRNGLKHMWRRRAEVGRDNEFDTENLKFKTTARWSNGWTNPRGVFGTPGSG